MNEKTMKLMCLIDRRKHVNFMINGKDKLIRENNDTIEALRKEVIEQTKRMREFSEERVAIDKAIDRLIRSTPSEVTQIFLEMSTASEADKEEASYLKFDDVMEEYSK